MLFDSVAGVDGLSFSHPVLGEHQLGPPSLFNAQAVHYFYVCAHKALT